jgi:hypothetical protein
MLDRRFTFAVCAALIALPVMVGDNAYAADKPVSKRLLKSCDRDRAKACDDLYKRCKRMFIPDTNCLILLPVCAIACK